MELLVEETGTFTVQLTNSNQVGIIELVNIANIYQQYTSLNTRYTIGFKFLLEDLQGTVNLTNGGANNGLTIAFLPNVEASDTNAEKEVKNQQVIAASQKIGLRFHKMKVGSNTGWTKISEAVLMNHGFEMQRPFLNPYFSLKPIKLFGKDDRIGVEIINYGNGVLRASDFILIEGSYSYQISGVPLPSASAIPSSFSTLVANNQTTILAENLSRRGFIIYNNGPSKVWLNFNDVAEINNGIPLLVGGNFVFNEAFYKLTTSVTAITESPSTSSLLTGMEYF